RRCSMPPILRLLRCLLVVTPAAPNVHSRDIGDSDLDLCVGFEVSWMPRGRRMDLLPILLDPQIELSFGSHRNDKTDIERAHCGGELSGELAHRADGTRNWNRNRSALRGQGRMFCGNRLQARSESNFVINRGLCVLGLVL